MAGVACQFATLEDALRAHCEPLCQHASTPLLGLKAQRRQIFKSVFQTDFSLPTPHVTPTADFPDQGQPFGGPPPAAPSQDRPYDDDIDLPDAAEEGQMEDSVAGTAHPARQREGEEQLPHHAGSFFPASAATATSKGYAQEAADDQLRFDRAWHVVTARIALPSSVAMEDSFGPLAPESQIPSQDAAAEAEFREALHLLLFARTALPRASQTEDILSWHTKQTRQHYAQHVLPMLSACSDGAVYAAGATPQDIRYYDRHMMVVSNSVRTLEAAFRLYFFGLMLLVRGLPASAGLQDGAAEAAEAAAGLSPSMPTPDAVVARFRRDVHALVAHSVPRNLLLSIRIILTRMASILLGFGAPELTAASQGRPPKPQPPAESDSQIQAWRQQLHELLDSLLGVGLAGEEFQIMFAEAMDQKMVQFIHQSFAGVWAEDNDDGQTPMAMDSSGGGGGGSLDFSRPGRSLRPGRNPASAAPTSIARLYDWVENHFARLAHEVLAHVGKAMAVGGGGKHEGGGGGVSFSDMTIWKETALGRLSALRMQELFDIVLHWPRSRAGLEDLRVSVTTPQRRSELVAVFSAALRRRLLNPARSTLEILQTYIAVIRAFHVLDPSNVLLSAAVGPLQLYLCQRDDAVRIVVNGLLADVGKGVGGVETVAEKMLRSTQQQQQEKDQEKLVELAMILNDPAQQWRRHIDEEEPDWNDMDWMPDPIDAGTHYRRPKSEDVIGALINALGSREAFTKEFQNIVAERLLSPQQVGFAKEVRVLNLLKKRFGEAALQNCEVMIRDIQDSNRLDTMIMRGGDGQQPGAAQPETRAATRVGAGAGAGAGAWSWTRPADDVAFQARILSRLYWPRLGATDTFRLPLPVAMTQERYEEGYQRLKSKRKLSWLQQLGQAHVELELADRTLDLHCKTYEAAVIYAFQDEDGEEEGKAAEEPGNGGRPPARRTASGLVDMLQMDEDLVDLALEFWQKQGVLQPDGGSSPADSFVVVERLSTKGEEEEEKKEGVAAAAAAPAAPAAPAAATRGDDAQRTVYWQFIVGMLTNSAASMPLAQIGMMMKMLIAGGFSWSNEELLEFLGEKVADGELEVTSGKYRLVKK